MSAFGGRKLKDLPPVLSNKDIPEDQGKLIILYGAGGSGKTKMCQSLYDFEPTSDAMWLVSDQKGLATISDDPRLKWMPFNDYESLVNYFETIRENPPNKTLVLDHYTRDVYLCFEGKLGPPPWQWQQYGGPTAELKAFSEGLDAMCKIHNMLIVLICHDHYGIDPETNQKRYDFNLSDGVAKNILPNADFVMHLEDTGDSKGTRRLRMRGGSTLGKKRLPETGPKSTIPNEIYFPSYPTFVPIMRTLWLNEPFPVAQYTRGKESDGEKKSTAI